MITSPADTLVCDSAQLAAFRSDAAYDYNRELITPEINIFEWIRGQFGELLGKIFGSRFAEEYSGLIMICLAILLLLLIVWFVYKKRPELFMRSHKNSLPYTVEEDTIYGVDFPKGIDEALSRRIAQKTGMDAEEIGTFVREVRPVIYGGRVISAEQMKLYIDKMSEIINHI